MVFPDRRGSISYHKPINVYHLRLEVLYAAFFSTSAPTHRAILFNSVWSVRGPVLSWIVFQVGQPLGLVGATAGVGSMLWLPETTIQANWDASAALHSGETVQTAPRHSLMGLFQGHHGAGAPRQNDALFSPHPNPGIKHFIFHPCNLISHVR